MLQRCLNPRAANFGRYGGRGITVCDRWRVYDNFLADMGRRPSAFHTLDRINNAGHYEPTNCRWADQATQSRNKRSNAFLELNGERKLLCEWAQQYGLRPSLICNRMNKLGWSVERAITTPADSSRFKPRTGLTAKAKAAGVKVGTFYARLRRGLSIEDALKT